jgi:hypothetical protein
MVRIDTPAFPCHHSHARVLTALSMPDNAFVGHYEAGNIQYNGHQSHGNLNLLYWKETSNFHNGCSAHLTGGSYSQGNMALPDHATFLVENTVFGRGVSLEANHHCNVGVTGILCFPTYMFHNVQWKNTDSMKRVWFQWKNEQTHNANQNHGGVFTLSPPDAQRVMNGGELEHSIFPSGFVSLVSSKFSYLLSLPNQVCVPSTQFGQLYDGGILCRVPLRALKVYSQGLVPGNAPNLKVEIWFNKGGVANQIGNPDSTQLIGFHQTGWTPRQGFSFPVITSVQHSYRLSLTTGNGDIPSSWIVEFSDFIVGNRFSIEFTNLSLNGRRCGQNGLVSSHHDRRFMWSGDQFMTSEAWGKTGACAINLPPDSPRVDCSSINDGVLPADNCPEKCTNGCDETNQYCDCGTGTCKFKPGFTESGVGLCSAARCEEHGRCSAQYLGGQIPVTSNACICDEGWSGKLCQFNPCQNLGKTCSGKGTCIATSDNDAKCVCDAGFSGENCETSCDGFCRGAFPYGCAIDLAGKVKYGCNQSGGCHYLSEGQQFPSGFCTYKEASKPDCLCSSDNDCEKTVSCNSDGSCPSPRQYLPDETPCNSIPFGTCKSGICIGPTTGTVKPTSRKPTTILKPTTSPPTPTIPTPPPSPTTITIQAESYLWMQGVQTEDTSDVGGGKNVGYIDTGDWMSYSEVTIPSTGAYRVEYRVASGSSGGSLQLEKAGGTQVYGGTVSIPSTGGWQNWQTVSHTVTLNAGPIALGIKAISGGWNINWFRITMTTFPTTPQPTTRKPTQTPTNEPTSESPTTESPVELATPKPTTRKPTTRKPSTRKPTQMPTYEPTTESPTTESPTTESPTTESPTTESPTTAQPTSKPTTTKPTTRKPSTRKPSTRKPTTSKPIL